jgi:uncharacterized protein
MTRFIRKLRIRQRKMKTSLRDTYVFHVLGERIFDRHIWNLDNLSLAGGVSLGLFVAFTPTIPFQMLLAAIGAILLRVNLPIALLACWITNPLTALPIYVSALRLGRQLLGDTRIAYFLLDFFDLDTRAGKFMEQGLYLWTGSLFFAVLSSTVGYLVVRLSWSFGHWLRGRISRHPGDRTP